MSGDAPHADDCIVLLRDVAEHDLAIFFEQQREPEADRMAALAPRGRDEFMAHWASVLADATVTKQSILCDGVVAGNVVSFDRLSVREVGYWIGEQFWGRGIATGALRALLKLERERPLHAGVVIDNTGSIRVLEKSGFAITGEEQEFSAQRGKTVTFVILRLDLDP